MPQLIIFDLDKTLARSKQSIVPSMATVLGELTKRTKMAVISGGAFPQFMAQVVAELPPETELENLFLMPTSGAALYQYAAGLWEKVYEEHIPEDEAIRIDEAIRLACKETGLVDFVTTSYGNRIENRGAQVTLSALGQRAPIEEKEAWDPTGAKKKELREAVAKRLPEYDVKSGGSTSIDVTKRGINKAFGVRKIGEHLHISIDQMLYVGDALFPGGNDEVVKETGIKTHEVKDPEDTEQFLRTLLADV